MHQSTEEVGFRHLWGQAKREELIETEPRQSQETLYELRQAGPLPLGLPFVQTAVERGLVRLASTVRFVSNVVPGREDQP